MEDKILTYWQALVVATLTGALTFATPQLGPLLLPAQGPSCALRPMAVAYLYRRPATLPVSLHRSPYRALG